MYSAHEPQGLNLKAAIAAVIAAGLVGLFGLMLIGGFGTADSPNAQFSEAALPQGARYPITTEKFAPGRIDVTSDDEAVAAYPALCHGEGLMDPANQDLLLGDNQTVAQYCEPKARLAGGPETIEPETGPTYPGACHGEGLLVPMDPGAGYDGPGSTMDTCTLAANADGEPNGQRQAPSNIGLTEESDY
jgi:hypothetical protein